MSREKRSRRQFTAEQTAATLRRHLVDPVADVASDHLGHQTADRTAARRDGVLDMRTLGAFLEPALEASSWLADAATAIEELLPITDLGVTALPFRNLPLPLIPSLPLVGSLTENIPNRRRSHAGRWK